MLVLVTYGLGMLIGAQVAGNVYNSFLNGASSLTLEAWQQFWFIPAAFAAGVMVLFGLLFKERIERAPVTVTGAFATIEK